MYKSKQMFDSLWSDWKIDKFLGKGSVGTVYKIYNKSLFKTKYSALKIITIPTESQIHNIKQFHKINSNLQLEKYINNIVLTIKKEIRILSKQTGNSYIVRYEDHLIKKTNDNLGWKILIRMELLNTLKNYLLKNKITIEDIIKIGIDILTGLESCHNLGIIHRDIKEDNIFVSKSNKFKLGDFSAARELTPDGFASTQIGTLHYMPPEVFFGMPYNKTADIYSLGIVLYKLLNHNRIPFLPKFPEIVEPKHFNSAQMERLSKKTPLPPYHGDKKLHKIILKALSPIPENRYQIANDMRHDLQDLLYMSLKYRKSILFDYSNKNNTLLKLFNKK